MKAYRSYKDLKKNEVETIDYCIRHRNGNSGIAVMAPHGGAIERGTAEVADAVAGRQHSYYAFWGLKDEHNARLHLSSTAFDEPVAVDLARNSGTILTIHGCKEQHHIVYLGGRDNRLKETIFKSLRQADFTVGESARLPGLKPENLPDCVENFLKNTPKERLIKATVTLLAWWRCSRMHWAITEPRSVCGLQD